MEAFIGFFSYVFWVLIAITILVFVHELGHFLAAKLFGMRVERFSIGFPPKIFGKKIGDTEYAIGATPLGGYVKITGMVDESMDTTFAGEEPKPYEFRAKPVWQRVVVIVAGVVFNILLAIAIFVGLKYAYGESYISADNAVFVSEGTIAHEMGLRTGDRIAAVNDRPIQRFEDVFTLRSFLVDSLTMTVVRDGQRTTVVAKKEMLSDLMNRADAQFGIAPGWPSVVGDVMPGSPAERAGLQPGDRILSINDQSIRFWEEMVVHIQASEGAPITVRWERQGETVHMDTSLALTSETDGRQQAGRVIEEQITPREIDGRYVLGINNPPLESLANEMGIEFRRYGIGEAIVGGATETWEATTGILLGFRRIVTGKENFRESVGGPIAIAQITKQAAERGAQTFWYILAMLSITLAIINILPVPALDGGHLMFLVYEGVTRREPSLRVRMAMQQVGMVLLLALMVFVIFNDIMRL